MKVVFDADTVELKKVTLFSSPDYTLDFVDLLGSEVCIALSEEVYQELLKQITVVSKEESIISKGEQAP